MKCLINGSVILSNKVERGLAIIFNEKSRKYPPIRSAFCLKKCVHYCIIVSRVSFLQ